MFKTLRDHFFSDVVLTIPYGHMFLIGKSIVPSILSAGISGSVTTLGERFPPVHELQLCDERSPLHKCHTSEEKVP